MDIGTIPIGSVPRPFLFNLIEGEDHKKTKCSGIMCMMYCPNGFQKDANGCDMCRCASSPVKKLPTTWTRPEV